MRLVLAFLLFSNVAFADALPYLDNDFGCFTAEDAGRYFTDFKVDVESFGGVELCDSAKGAKLLLNDLSLIEKTQFGADAPQYFVEGIVPKDNYYGWAKDQTKGVRRAHDDPTATAYNQWGRFTMQDGWQASSSLGRVGTLIHEARHTRGYPHTPCSSGPYANSSAAACDESLAERGANAVEMEYYARVVLESTNLNPVYKSMARLMAMGRTNFIFNEKPMKVREGLLAAGGGKATLLDGAQVSQKDLPSLHSAYRLKRTSAGAALVNGVQSFALDLYENDPAGNLRKDDYSYFKLFQIDGDRLTETPVDAQEVDIDSQRYFVALSDRGNLFSFNFPEGQWFEGVEAPAGARAVVPTAPNGQRGIFVVTERGEVQSFQPADRSFARTAAATWPANVSAFAFAGEQLVKLEQGRGRALDARTNAPLAALPGLYTDLVNVPLYDAFDVKP